MVDRFTVLAPSPPVPTMSTVSWPISSVGTRRAWVSMMSASSRTSAAVGRFIFIDTAKPEICAGVAAPVMIWSIAHAAWPLGRFWPVVSRPRIRGHDGPSSGPEADGNG
ncbi:hypothetical protein AFA91_18800 [Mycolicibacterium goodii]|uniref:Uncharacterized protein n=1 Tax=Mycolicibacterium goodii TaxID=134601 RepID=A0A0K0XGC6_MYCGD|nr:hypothetical protein AFA91_18800 [Mycolicibacterium goodii]